MTRTVKNFFRVIFLQILFAWTKVRIIDSVQYCIVSCNINVLYSTVLHSIVLYCTVQYSIVLYRTVQYSKVHYSTLQSNSKICSDTLCSRYSCKTVFESNNLATDYNLHPLNRRGENKWRLPPNCRQHIGHKQKQIREIS